MISWLPSATAMLFVFLRDVLARISAFEHYFDSCGKFCPKKLWDWKILLIVASENHTMAVRTQFWGGFLQGALIGTQRFLQQEQVRQRQEEQRKKQEEANRIEKELKVEKNFKWYKVTQRGNVGAIMVTKGNM